MEESLKEHETAILVLLTTLAVSYGLSQWIHENYYLLEYIFLILVFGLIHEAWSNLQTDEDLHDFLRVFGADSTTGMQIALLLFVGSAVFLSIQLRNFVEQVFGPLSVVQLLGIIVLLSRAFVNVYTTDNAFAIFDGKRDTYATYTAGITAFILSWYIRDHYPAYTLLHNMLTIWPSIIIPWSIFYYSKLGEMLSPATLHHTENQSSLRTKKRE